MERNKLIKRLDVRLKDEPVEQREDSIRINVDRKLMDLFTSVRWEGILPRANKNYSLTQIGKILDDAGLKDISPEEFVTEIFKADKYLIYSFEEIKFVSGKSVYKLKCNFDRAERERDQLCHRGRLSIRDSIRFVHSCISDHLY